jgi:acetyl-CoA C-acetyltransferase
VTDVAYIYDALRTPRGKNRDGALHSIKPVDLVVGLLRQIVPRNPGFELADIDDIVLGVVSPVGEQGGDMARTAALAGGLPQTVAGVQLNRFCASGLEAVNTAAAKVLAGDSFVLAGGVESMSRVPMGWPARTGRTSNRRRPSLNWPLPVVGSNSDRSVAVGSAIPAAASPLPARWIGCQVE